MSHHLRIVSSPPPKPKEASPPLPSAGCGDPPSPDAAGADSLAPAPPEALAAAAAEEAKRVAESDARSAAFFNEHAERAAARRAKADADRLQANRSLKRTWRLGKGPWA